MNLVSSKLPLSLVALGGILIIVSFMWSYVVPPARINAEQINKDLIAAAAKGHEAVSVDPAQASGTHPSNQEAITTEEAIARQKHARAVIERAQFMQKTAPKVINYVGVLLAVIGCILYPLQLLARQAKVDAEREEADGTTVVE